MPFGADPTLGALTQPSPINPNATPEEKMAYEAGWNEYLKRPEIRDALLQFGASALRPIPIQQSGASALADSALAGVGAYSRNIADQQAQAQQAQKEQVAQQELGLRGRQVGATETGNQLQYDLGMAQLKSRENIAAAAALARQRVAEIMGDSRIDATSKTQLGNFLIYNPNATPEEVDAFAARLGIHPDAGKGPATGEVTPHSVTTTTVAPTISTQEEYQALAPGAKYQVPNDSATYTKPAATQ